MKHKNLLVAALLFVPLASMAQRPERGGRMQGERRPVSDAEREQRREGAEKRMRTARLIGIAEALELDDAAALRMRDTLARFDERRAPHQKAIAEAAKTLRAAAKGEASAQGQVDAIMARMFDARTQLAAIDRELYGELSRGLSNQQKAKLAIFFAKFHDRARGMMKKRLRRARTQLGMPLEADDDSDEGDRYVRVDADEEGPAHF